MVDKLTIFELRMDNPRIGGFGVDDDVLENEYDGVEYEESTEREGGRRRPRIGRLILASLILSVVVSTGVSRLARRFRGSDEEPPIEIDGVDEETPIEVEH